MRREFSAALDLVRLCAASAVFIGHLGKPEFGGAQFAAIGAHGRSAVVVFFVLSGFVIAWTARREATAMNYVVARGARIYSVAVPALILTYLLDVSTGNISYQHLAPWKYVPLFLSFTTDFWFLNESAFSNVPWWSLCYEVWFYVVFGIVFFGRGVVRWIAAAVCLAIMGPRLWLLFPIWLMGVAIHRAPKLPHARFALAAAVFGLVALKLSGIEDVLNNGIDALMLGFAKSHLRYSQYFVGDFLFGSLIALMIWALRDSNLDLLGRFKTTIAVPASISFSIYLTHEPLLRALSHLFPRNPLAIGGATLFCVVIFGVVFERHKQVARRVILKLLAPLPIWGAQVLPARPDTA
jgi:peptidoglycan/LPS O-acetylase OafA/YrhL